MLIPGDAGAIEVLVGTPVKEPRGVAVIAHPQPMLGGSASHKIVDFIARALEREGFVCLRPNFRGVGRTEGAYDAGLGETDDLVQVLQWAAGEYNNAPVTLIGYSFGAFVVARAAARQAAAGEVLAGVVVAGCPYGAVKDGRFYDTPPPLRQTLVIHGENDERVPLASVFDWCRAQSVPVVVFPGADHGFTGQLAGLRQLVLSYVLARMGPP